MISFYVEMQPDDLLKASFFGKNDEEIGFTQNISIDQIDSAINDIFPDIEKTQIFEKPDVI